MSPSHAALTPTVACTLPAASAKFGENVVSPANVKPTNGRSCRSAALADPAAANTIAAATTQPMPRPLIPVIRPTRLPDEQPQKHARERRHRDIAGREVHRPREAR